MSAMAAGSVNTTWKYGTGSRSASRAASHSLAAVPWHLGQCRLRQLMGVAHYLPYGKFRNGELAISLDGNLTAFRASTLINVPFALHYDGAFRDSRVARSRFARHGVFGMSLRTT